MNYFLINFIHLTLLCLLFCIFFEETSTFFLKYDLIYLKETWDRITRKKTKVKGKVIPKRSELYLAVIHKKFLPQGKHYKYASINLDFF